MVSLSQKTHELLLASVHLLSMRMLKPIELEFMLKKLAPWLFYYLQNFGITKSPRFLTGERPVKK